MIDMPVYGFWEVSTEGDCEGKTSKKLGIHKGYLDEVALHLGNKACYGLYIKEATDKNPLLRLEPNCNSVNISLDIKTNTWDLSPSQRAIEIGKFLKDRPVVVSQSNYHACVTLTSKEYSDEIKKKAALAKLTPEEKRLLGL